MISILTHGSKKRRVEHEIVADEFDVLCASVSTRARDIKKRLENGAGEALKKAIPEAAKSFERQRIH